MNLFAKRSGKFLKAALDAPSIASTVSIPAGILSPAPALASVLFPDLDFTNYPVTEAEALAVPAVKKAIYLYATLSSRFKLDSEDNSTPWLAEGNGFVTPQLRIARSVVDLLFYNHTLWQVERDSFGTITAAAHVEKGRWAVDANGVVKIDDKPVTDKQFIFFQGLLPGNGFLEDARHSIRQYTAISQTISNRVAVSEPAVLVKETVESNSSPEEIDEMLDELQRILASARGGLLHVPYGLDIVGFGSSDNANTMMISARNACRLDVSNHMFVAAALLEGASDGSSDTYQNSMMVANELLELSLKGITEPICDRLTAELGVKVSFDYSSFDRVPNDPSSMGTIPTSTEEGNSDD